MLCVFSGQTIFEIGESYNLHRYKLYDSRGGGGGSYNLHDPFNTLSVSLLRVKETTPLTFHRENFVKIQSF